MAPADHNSSLVFPAYLHARDLVLVDEVRNSTATTTTDLTGSPVGSSSSWWPILPTDDQDSINVTLVDHSPDYDSDLYIFHELRVKIPLLIVYSLVFVLAFFGNLLVVLVMTLHRRMRSHTNFFLTNLAVADLGVAVFCVYQNFAMYVIHDWYLGQFLCLMYHFVTSLSCTASVIILVVVSGERYLAIVEPLRAKSLLTRRNMVSTMVMVWIFSALYSCPRLLYFEVAEYPVEGGKEAMCILRRDLFDTKIWDVVSLILLFLLPLLLLTVLYLRIAQVLYASSKLLAQVSYCDSGKFSGTSPRPSATVTGRGCLCSTKQEYLSCMSDTNNRRRFSQENFSPTNVSEHCPVYNPTILNDINRTQTKPKGFQRFRFATRWRKSKTGKESLQNTCYGYGNESCFNLQNKRIPCTSDACLHKVLIQENSGSYSSVTETEMSNHRKNVDVYCETKSELPSYIGNNYHNHNLTIPITDEVSNRSLQEDAFLETPLNNAVLKPRSLQNIPNATKYYYASLNDQHARKTIAKDRYRSRGNSDLIDENHFKAQHLQNEIQDRVNSYGNNAARQREQMKRAAIVMRPSPVVLKARRKVVHMLVLVVVSFAVFSLPFHARKMMQYFLPAYNHTSNFSMLFTPVTCLIMFAHSAVNPILYTCLSRKFRASLKDLFKCKLTRRSNGGTLRAPVINSKPLLARLNSDGRVSLQLH